MRVAVWPGDEAGCGHYRLLYPAWTLARQGLDVRVDPKGPTILWDRQWEGTPGPDVRLVGLAEPYDTDVVVMQRPARRWWAELIPHLQDAGVRVVVDVDDRFDRIHPAHASKALFEQPHHHHRWIDQACKLADVVTATTPALVDRYGYGHGRLLPNLIPAHYLGIRAEKRHHSLGWTGTTSTHPGDLEVTGGTVGAVLGQLYGWQFRAVGDGAGVGAALHLDPEMVSATGWLGFDAYPHAYAELEAAIVPLADTPFNRAKSALKMLEAAALGVPVVGSPTPDNQRAHRAGIGLLAASPGQWRRHLRRLVASPELRADLAGRGREVAAGMTYEKHAGRWAEAWQAALDMRRTAA